MVFSAGLYTTSNTGVGVRKPADAANAEPVVDPEGYPTATKLAAADKSDVLGYVMKNAPIIGLAGLVTGLQTAFYKFERMPPEVSRPSFSQASTLGGIIAKRSLFAVGLGTLFCATEAYVENYRGQHDSTSGIVAGLVAGAAYGMTRPLPQPIVWPLVFAGTALAADTIAETIPACMKGFRYYGPLEHRPSWGDVAPPRPPILDTGAATRPAEGGSFWRGP